jgi:hypothetical protein
VALRLVGDMQRGRQLSMFHGVRSLPCNLWAPGAVVELC